MEGLFEDKTKYKLFSQIQSDLIDLPSNPKEGEINNFINKIPSCLLNNKNDLKTICQLFASYARNVLIFHKRNAISLYEKIMPQIKTHLQHESSFFSTLFDHVNYMKLWLHQEGLISINSIIQSMYSLEETNTIDYFYPEIIEKAPETYSKEAKFKLNKNFSEDEINEFKEMRKKHFKWLRESGDFNDQIYSEIEKDPLRLSIKRDDIEKFQMIISKSNISINSKISESLLEICNNFKKVKLIEYAVQFNAIQIFKFLIMNDCEIRTDIVYWLVQQNNYDMIHMIRGKLGNDFYEFAILPAVRFWNMDMVNFLIDNYFEPFIENGEIDEKFRYSILKLTVCTFFNENFLFFELFVIPFFQRRKQALIDNLSLIVSFSVNDYSCFFLKELIKHPNLNVNEIFNVDQCLLNTAISSFNTEAIKMIINIPNIEIPINSFANLLNRDFNMEIIPYFFDSLKDKFESLRLDEKVLAFQECATSGNINALSFFLKKFPVFVKKIKLELICKCFLSNKFVVIKFLLKTLCESDKSIERLVLESLENEPEFKNINDLRDFYRRICNKVVGQDLI